MKKVIATITAIILLTTIGAGATEAYGPTEANDTYGYVNALLPYDNSYEGSDAVDGGVVRTTEGYVGLFIADVNDNRPVRISVRLSGSRTVHFDCEVYLYNSYSDSYKGTIEGRPAIIYIPADSDFWKLAGDEDVWYVFFGSLEDGARVDFVDDVYFHDKIGDSFHRYSWEDGWKSWLEVVDRHFGYLYTDADYSAI